MIGIYGPCSIALVNKIISCESTYLKTENPSGTVKLSAKMFHYRHLCGFIRVAGATSGSPIAAFIGQELSASINPAPVTSNHPYLNPIQLRMFCASPIEGLNPGILKIGHHLHHFIDQRISNGLWLSMHEGVS